MKLTSVDDLFSTEESRAEAEKEHVQEIPIAEIDGFPEHPFHVDMDDAMREMVESVKRFGVLSPAVARQKEDGRYELISGHRRKKACELAGMECMPVIVRNMDRDEAIIFMVDSNLQRERLLPSEKAFSYKMRLEAMKRKAGRPGKENASPLATNYSSGRSDSELSRIIGEGKDNIRRYIRLTELTPDLLKMVDEGKIAFRPAVELSYLSKEEQASLLMTMESEVCTPSLAQAIKIKKFSQEGRLNDDVILSILSEEKPNQKEVYKLPKERLDKYFPKGTPPEKIEEIIFKALELYRKRERSREMER
ncbi:MAG: ParB/RepB/Spo0J family partition protein [Christensenellaceae bacterium]|nr:ParB/RepB/Spo0J family partition protein [Christensenellaceae bacterium]